MDKEFESFEGEMEKNNVLQEMLVDEEKNEVLKNQLKIFGRFKMEDKIECINCGEQFLFKEVKVFRFRNSFTSADVIMCKNYPDCEGSFADLHSVSGIENHFERDLIE
ncbi:MAG: hypothetical protein MJ188_04855 [Treponema sp.]|nr:hypothetical protein [Treponema sp.]